MDMKKELHQRIVGNKKAGKIGENIIEASLRLANPKQYIQMEIIRLQNAISDNLNILCADWEFIGRNFWNLGKMIHRLKQSQESMNQLWEMNLLQPEFDILAEYIPTIIVLEDYLQRPQQEDLFTITAKKNAEKQDRSLINDIKSYLKSHKSAVDIYALISFLYKCKNVVRESSLKEIDWKNTFCEAFFIDTEIVKNYKSGNDAVKRKMKHVELEFYYLQ